MCDELMHGVNAETNREVTPPSFYFFSIFPSSLISYIKVFCVSVSERSCESDTVDGALVSRYLISVKTKIPFENGPLKIL